jgi:predicted nucleic acid-binding protein
VPRRIPARYSREANIYAALASAGPADYIVSRDDHLLSLKEHEGIPILRPRDFLVLLTELRGGEQAA